MVSLDRDGGVVTVAVSGEVDLATGPLVADAIGQAIDADGARAVRVDLSEVKFLDSSAIAVLLRGRRDADERGVGYRVFGAQGVPLQVLEMTGVWEHLSGGAGPEEPARP